MHRSSGAAEVIPPVAGIILVAAIPPGWIGALLLLVALGLFAADLHLGLTGILALAGSAALVAGLVILIGVAGPPFWLLFGVAALAALVCLAWIRVLRRSRRRIPVVGEQTMVGRQAKAVTPLDPLGYVLIGGENWRARLVAGRAEPGDLVSVTAVYGLELEVRRIGKGISGQQSSPFSGREGHQV